MFQVNWNANLGTSVRVRTVVVISLFVFTVPGTSVETVSFCTFFSTTKCSSKILYQNIIFVLNL